jgi:hypothetical protein
VQQISPQIVELARATALAAAAEYHRLQAQGEALPAPEWLSCSQVSALTGFTKRALESMRARGEGPPYTRLGQGGKLIRYPVVGLRSWLESGLVSR